MHTAYLAGAIVTEVWSTLNRPLVLVIFVTTPRSVSAAPATGRFAGHEVAVLRVASAWFEPLSLAVSQETVVESAVIGVVAVGAGVIDAIEDELRVTGTLAAKAGAAVTVTAASVVAAAIPACRARLWSAV